MPSHACSCLLPLAFSLAKVAALLTGLAAEIDGEGFKRARLQSLVAPPPRTAAAVKPDALVPAAPAADYSAELLELQGTHVPMHSGSDPGRALCL